MDPRLETLAKVKNELEKVLKEATNEKLHEALYRIYQRLGDAEKYIQDREDATGQPLTVKVIGHYILKTYRMTQEPNFNRILVKYMPGKYRKLTQLFGSLDKLAAEILSYDYKKLKQVEIDVRKIHPFLVKGENAFRTASSRESDSQKSAHLLSIADDMKELISMIYLGKRADQSLCPHQECVDKVSQLWSKLEGVKWTEFVTDELHNPTFLLQETTDKFEEVFKNIMVKKFSVKRKQPGEKPKSKTMEEDVIHIEFDPRRRRPLTRRSEMAPVRKKKGIPPGRTLPRKFRHKKRTEPIHKPGIDEVKPSFSPVKPKEEPLPKAEPLEGKADETKEPVVKEVKEVKKEAPSESLTPLKGEIKGKESEEVKKEEKDLNVKLPSHKSEPASKEVKAESNVSSKDVGASLKSTKGVSSSLQSSAPKIEEKSSSLKKPSKRVKDAVRKIKAVSPPLEKPKSIPPLADKEVKKPPVEMFRKVEKVSPPDEGKGAKKKPKSFEEEIMGLLIEKREKAKSGPLKAPKTSLLTPDGKGRPRSFLSAALKEKGKPRSFLSKAIEEKAKDTKEPEKKEVEIKDEEKPEPVLMAAKPSVTEMLPPLETFFEETKKEKEQEQKKKEEEEEGVSIADAIREAEKEKKEKKKLGCLPAFVGIGASIVALLLAVLKIFLLK